MNLKTLINSGMVALLLFSVNVLFAGDLHNDSDPLLKTHIKNIRWKPDQKLQNNLALGEPWQQFISNSGTWSVMFDESSMLPKVAYGTPVYLPGADAAGVAMTFINDRLKSFSVNSGELAFISITESSKYKYVNYSQKYNGLDVLFSYVQIKMNKDHSVNLFRMSYYPGINIGTTPVLSAAAASAAATNGVDQITSVNVSNDLKLLPVPSYHQYNYHLVYEVMVKTMGFDNVPKHYYTLVDANNGEVLYRHNQVYHIANTDVNMSGTIYTTHPYDPTSVEPLPNMKIVVNGTTYYTDSVGYLGLTNTTAVNANISLEGKWSRVRTNNVTPSWSVNLQPGVNNLTADNNSNIKERSAYRSVNQVHDYMKSKFPLFTGLDFSLNTNIDVAGSCNAFYNGSSINFFDQGGGCYATSLVADVVYHEYGHGINDEFYTDNGFSWQNGAMGEGYADIWALGITASPVLGIGFFQNDPTGFVRRYDVDKKVYPQDLVGEVHADGEIIAGAWWDTGINLGNLQQMMDMFAETYYAGLTEPDGNEGVLYTDILIEALMVDDNDGNLSNGTPNYCDITSAFAEHGISLSSASGFSHSEILAAAAQQPVTVQVSIASLPSGSTLKGFYDVNSSGSWTPFSFVNTSGSNYEGTIPGQSNGNIISYYLAIEDNCGTMVNVTPPGSADIDPNIPYYILVGYSLLHQEDFDVFAGVWQEGLPTDGATTGNWVIDIPIASFVGTGMVQTGTQNTPGGLFCAVTANAQNANSPAGEQDVDDGVTTLISPPFDLTTYTNPAITYYRWFSNDQGATPGTDFWQVAISGDGINWTPVENTKVSDHGWRRFALRVQDYITPTATTYLRFIAEDANAGSLIEAAIDDVVLWDEVSTGVNEQDLVSVNLYPNPAADQFQLSIGLLRNTTVDLEMIDDLGRVVQSSAYELAAGANNLNINTSGLAKGIYQVRIISDNFSIIRKVTLVK